MIRKLTLLVGVGAGYVLGAKAGTERYDQIVAKAREIAGQPAVQKATGNITSTASTLADKTKATVNEKVGAVNDKVSGSAGTSSPTGRDYTSTSTSTTPSTTTDYTGATSPASVVDLDTDPVIATPVVTTTPMPGATESFTAPDPLR